MIGVREVFLFFTTNFNTIFGIKDELKENLEKYIVRFVGKVRLIRTKERLGLIRAKIEGAKNATGEVVVFLDSHCEANHGWFVCQK